MLYPGLRHTLANVAGRASRPPETVQAKTVLHARGHAYTQGRGTTRLCLLHPRIREYAHAWTIRSVCIDICTGVQNTKGDPGGEMHSYHVAAKRDVGACSPMLLTDDAGPRREGGRKPSCLVDLLARNLQMHPISLSSSDGPGRQMVGRAGGFGGRVRMQLQSHPP